MRHATAEPAAARPPAARLSDARPPVAPPAPKHLAAATRRWWKSVCENYDLEEHHLRLLQLAGEAWDRGQEARKLLQKDGLTVVTAAGLKQHPACALERDSRLAFARLIRELELDTEPPAAASRPPALKSNRRGR